MDNETKIWMFDQITKYMTQRAEEDKWLEELGNDTSVEHMIKIMEKKLPLKKDNIVC